MTLWAAIALGALQGLTEFLPVSSSGHLVVARAVLGLRAPGATLEVWLHLGTLVALVLGYRRPLVRLATAFGPGGAAASRSAFRALALASLPAAAVGLLARHALEANFSSLQATAAGLIATSCLLASLLFLGDGAQADAKTSVDAAAPVRPPSPGAVRALVIGLAQAAALLPGLSRSGATIAVGRWLGLGGADAASFSFLLSIPAVLGAAALELGGHGLGAVWNAPALAGAVTAALTGSVALRLVQRLVGHGGLALFAPYTLCLAALLVGRL